MKDYQIEREKIIHDFKNNEELVPKDSIPNYKIVSIKNA